jgi:hypothetical protein
MNVRHRHRSWGRLPTAAGKRRLTARTAAALAIETKAVTMARQELMGTKVDDEGPLDVEREKLVSPRLTLDRTWFLPGDKP